MNERLQYGLIIVFCLLLLMLGGTQAYQGIFLHETWRGGMGGHGTWKGREAVNAGLMALVVCGIAIAGIVWCVKAWRDLDF